MRAPGPARDVSDDPSRAVDPIVLRDVKKGYDGLLVLDLSGWSARAGSCHWIRGENGAGKSTLLRSCAGLVIPDEGDVRIVGAPAGSRAARTALSFVPDIPALYDDLSVSEQCQYVAGLHRVPRPSAEERIDVLLARFGVSSRRDALPRALSRGLRQKVSLIMGLVRPFKVLLLDEPFEGLDERGVSGLLESIDEAVAAGAAVVVAGQRLPVDRLACDPQVTHLVVRDLP